MSRTVQADVAAMVRREGYAGSADDRRAAEDFWRKVDGDDSVNPKDLIGATKAPLRLVPPAAIALVAEVMKVGAQKYGPYNWRDYKVQYETYVEAAMRHLFAFADGEDNDPETGLSHLAHAAAGLMILMDARSICMAKDNRPKPGSASAIMRNPMQKAPGYFGLPALPESVQRSEAEVAEIRRRAAIAAGGPAVDEHGIMAKGELCRYCNTVHLRNEACDFTKSTGA